MVLRNKLIEELTNLIIEQVKLYKKSLDTRGRKNIYLYKEIINIFLTRLETNLIRGLQPLELPCIMNKIFY